MPDRAVIALFDEHCAAPFPRLGVGIGTFPVYDALIAGWASRAVNGERISSFRVSEPDMEIAEAVRRLRASSDRTAPESEFLNYFDRLERLRKAISDEPVDILVPLMDEGTDVWVVAQGNRIGCREFLILSFEDDLARVLAVPRFGIGAKVHVDGGDAVWDDGVVVGVTSRIAARAML